MTDAETLERLVALNAERAAEEQRSVIHWLRPEYQARPPAVGTKQSELTLPEAQPRKPAKPKAIRKTKTAWGKTLVERVQAVEAALHAAPGPVTPADLATQFTRAKPEDVAEILETLATLGRADRSGDQFTR